MAQAEEDPLQIAAAALPGVGDGRALMETFYAAAARAGAARGARHRDSGVRAIVLTAASPGFRPLAKSPTRRRARARARSSHLGLGAVMPYGRVLDQ